MTENIVVSFAKQLGAMSPVLLVYLVGMVLSLVLWRRSPTASLLCLIGLGLLLVTAVVVPFVNLFVIRSMSTQGGSHEKVSMLLNVSSVMGNVVRALAMGLLVGAVFSGRKKSKPSPPEVVPIDEPIQARPRDRGITRPLGGETFTTNN